MTKEDLLLALRVLKGEYDPIADPGAAGKALATLTALLYAELGRLDAPPAPPPPAEAPTVVDRPAAPPAAGLSRPTAVDGSVASAPAAPLPDPHPASTVAGSGGPQNSYEVRMTPHPRAVGMCPDCGGQLRHAPTCSKYAR